MEAMQTMIGKYKPKQQGRGMVASKKFLVNPQFYEMKGVDQKF